jgi:hypothetical protein
VSSFTRVSKNVAHGGVDAGYELKRTIGVSSGEVEQVEQIISAGVGRSQGWQMPLYSMNLSKLPFSCRACET